MRSDSQPQNEQKLRRMKQIIQRLTTDLMRLSTEIDEMLGAQSSPDDDLPIEEKIETHNLNRLKMLVEQTGFHGNLTVRDGAQFVFANAEIVSSAYRARFPKQHVRGLIRRAAGCVTRGDPKEWGNPYPVWIDEVSVNEYAYARPCLLDLWAREVRNLAPRSARALQEAFRLLLEYVPANETNPSASARDKGQS